MPKTLALDVDSVLFPINELVVLPLMSARLGRTVAKSEITDWDYSAIPGGKEIAYSAFRRPSLYDPYTTSDTPGLGPALKRLRAMFRVIAVSSPFAGHATSKWRYLQRLGFDHADIVLTGDKRLVGFDLLVDDAPKYLLDLSPERALVFDQPWNGVEELVEYERAYGWEDLPDTAVRMLR
jgi:5'(3')-deoxyribonucleotidase